MDTALIVEDDHDQAQMAAQLVRLRDLNPVLADSGESGLRLARELHPSLILLDLMLPDIDGFDVCKRLRGDRETMLTPVVMLTALADSIHRRRGFWVGANAYVTKPYTPDDLFQAIAAAQAWRIRLEQSRVHGEILVELNSETAFLQEVNDFLANLCQTTPLAPEQINRLRQAVMELGMNAIEWGNRHRAEDLVRIVYRIHADRLEIVIRDEGIGFDPTDLPHAASPDDPIAHLDVREKLGIREGGFGVLISRGMVDELRYNDVGNEVTMVMRFRADPNPGTDEPPRKGRSPE
ncbi:MAG: ATP-binding protein [Isosphaeraceae bacterium]